MKKWLIIKINQYFQNSKTLIIYYNYSFDNKKIKKLIDYSLKFPSLNKKLNIESINSAKNNLENNKDDKNIFLSSYKYPYISSEILSHDYPFLLDKLINITIGNNNNSNNFGNVRFSTNTSIILNDMSNNELNFFGEELSDDNLIKKEILKEENFEFGSNENLENPLELSENERNLELIDYLFNISFAQELNGVQGGYFVKILRSLMHSLYSPNKSIFFIKYICFRKNGEILNNMIQNIKHFYFQEIIYDILIYNDEDNSFNKSGGLEKLKINIVSQLIKYLKKGVEGIKDMFCEYIINCKNEELLINDKIFNKFYSEFVFNDEFIFDIFCVVSSHILKQYKFENCLLNNSKSFIFRSSSFKGSLSNSIITLDVDDKDTIISKFNKIIKKFQLNILSSTSSKINFMTFIFDLMSLTRGNELLNNLKSIKYFIFIKKSFFTSKNDIIQSILINQFNLLLEDDQSASNQNQKWFYELLINNGFINDAMNIKNKSHSNYGLCSESLFIHIAIIFEKLIKNLSNFLTSNNILKKVEKFYNKEIKNYVERMNKPIHEINNTLNISEYLTKNIDNENELKVDEVSDIKDGTNNIKVIKSVFDLTETSFIRKNSTNPQMKEILSISQIDRLFSIEEEENKNNLSKKNKEKK